MITANEFEKQKQYILNITQFEEHDLAILCNVDVDIISNLYSIWEEWTKIYLDPKVRKHGLRDCHYDIRKRAIKCSIVYEIIMAISKLIEIVTEERVVKYIKQNGTYKFREVLFETRLPSVWNCKGIDVDYLRSRDSSIDKAYNEFTK